MEKPEEEEKEEGTEKNSKSISWTAWIYAFIIFVLSIVILTGGIFLWSTKREVYDFEKGIKSGEKYQHLDNKNNTSFLLWVTNRIYGSRDPKLAKGLELEFMASRPDFPTMN